jgi:hypothetical protein
MTEPLAGQKLDTGHFGREPDGGSLEAETLPSFQSEIAADLLHANLGVS